MGRTRTSTKPITEEQLIVKQPNKRKTKLKARVNRGNDSSDSSIDMELSPKSKKRSIAEVMGSDDEEQQIRPKAKKSRVAAKPKASKIKNKNINNTNVIFDESAASDDDFEVRNKRVTRESADDGDEVLFTARKEDGHKKQNKTKASVKQEKMRVSEDEPMSDLHHFVASDDEQEWEDVQWDDAMPAVSEIKREIKSEIDIALQHEESEASDAEDEGDEQGTKKKKKRESVRRASRAEKHQALELHRSHLLTLLAHALHGSTLADDQTLQASVLSLFAHSDISVEHDCEKEFLQSLTHLADWFASTFTISQSTAAAAIDLTVENVKPARSKKRGAATDDKLQALIDSCRTRKLDEQNAPIMFAALCRGLSLLTRVVHVLRPASHKVSVSDESAEPKKKKKPECKSLFDTCQ
jgi:hypothetical protein